MRAAFTRISAALALVLWVSAALGQIIGGDVYGGEGGHGQITPLFASFSGTPPSTSQSWVGVQMGMSVAGTLYNTSSYVAASQVVPQAGVIQNLSVSVNITVASGTWSVILLHNGNATPVVCSFSSGTTCASPAGASEPVAVGDTVGFEICPGTLTGATCSNVAATTENWQISAIFVAQPGVWRSPIFMSANNQTSTTVTNWIGPGGQYPPTPTNDTPVAGVMPVSGTIAALYGSITASPSPGTYTLYVYQNGVQQASTACVISTGTGCTKTFTAISFNPGDQLSCGVVPASAPASRFVSCGMRFTPTVQGQAPLFAVTSATPPAQSATNYLGVAGNMAASATENVLVQQKFPTFPYTGHNILLGNLYVQQSALAGTTRSVTLRSGAVSQAVACSMTGVNTCTDTSHTYSIGASAAPLLDWQTTDGAGTALTFFRASMTATFQ